jgi:hypothetical protein
MFNAQRGKSDSRQVMQYVLHTQVGSHVFISLLKKLTVV